MKQHLLRPFVLLFCLMILPLQAHAAMEKGGAAPKDDPALQATLTYEGAATISYQLLPDLARDFLAKGGVAFGNIGEAGSGAGFTAVVEGKVSMGGISRPIRDNEKAAVAAWQVIGHDAIGVFVHKDNPVDSLSMAQLKDIFTGKITNWSDVGGADLPILATTEKLDGGRATTQLFKDVVLGADASFGPVTEKEDPQDCLWAVEGTPGAISFATMSIATDRVKAVALDGVAPTLENVSAGKYKISRPLILLTMMPTGNVQKFFEYTLTPEAQAIVAKYFVPVK